MDARRQLVVFSLFERHYALRLSAVERIVPVVEITPLPKAPDIVLGVVNVAGRIVPAMDIRKRFRLADQEIRLSDHLIIARASTRLVALVVDATIGVIERSRSEITAAQRILPNSEYIEGVATLDDGLILIHDLDTFLSAGEEQALELAMTPA